MTKWWQWLFPLSLPTGPDPAPELPAPERPWRYRRSWLPDSPLWPVKQPEKIVERPPTVLIPQQVWQKLVSYTHRVHTEIGGFGTARIVGRDVLVEDVFTLPQNASWGGVEQDGETIARALDAFVARGGNAEHFRVQWHSHGHLGAFWSPTDDENIENLIALGNFFVSILLNHQGEVRCRLDLRSPLRLTLHVGMTVLLTPLDPAVRAELHREVAQNLGLEDAGVRRWFAQAPAGDRAGAEPDDLDPPGALPVEDTKSPGEEADNGS